MKELKSEKNFLFRHTNIAVCSRGWTCTACKLPGENFTGCVYRSISSLRHLSKECKKGNKFTRVACCFYKQQVGFEPILPTKYLLYTAPFKISGVTGEMSIGRCQAEDLHLSPVFTPGPLADSGTK